MAKFNKSNVDKDLLKKLIEARFDVILEAILKKAIQSKLKNTMLKLNSDLMGVMRYINFDIINQLMNIESKILLPPKVDKFMTVPYPVKFQWRYLSRKWAKWKRNRIFFVHTGTLKNRIAALDFAKKLGVFVYYEDLEPNKKNKKIRTVAKVVVKLLTNVQSIRVKQAIIEGKFDKDFTTQNWLTGPTREKFKLLGPKRVHRPLVFPVLHYYINKVIPRKVKKELSKWL